MKESPVFLPRPLARLALVVIAALAAVIASTGLASAHVTVSSPDAAAGGYGKVVFRVPNESDTASTVKIRIQVPTDRPLASVSVQPGTGCRLTDANGGSVGIWTRIFTVLAVSLSFGTRKTTFP